MDRKNQVEPGSWRYRARVVIRQTMAKLPPRTPPDEARKIVSAAYPFGERAMLPYKAWLTEMRLVFGRKPRELVISAAGSIIVCGHCPGGNGCLMCRGHRDELNAAIRQYPEVVAGFFEAMLARPEEAGIFGDWLEEHGWTKAANLYRRE